MNASAHTPINPFLQQQQQQQQGPPLRSNGHSHTHSQSSLKQEDDEQETTHHTSTNLRRGPWSPEEDRKLLDSINLFGATNWVRISQSIGSRTPKQCRERYHQNLKPSLNRNPITPEEGQLIEELVNKYGKRWAEIARHLNGRSDNAIKNWWNGGANRRRRASSQAILQETSHNNNNPHHLQSQPHHPLQPLPDYSQQNHPFSSPAFNTQIFQQKQLQQQQQQAQQQPQPHILHSYPPNQQPSYQQQQPQMLPPANPSRSVSMNQEIFQQQPGVKRFLEEQHIPIRRHSAQTILTSTAGSSSPFSASPLSRGPSSRNSSISFDWQNQNQQQQQQQSINNTSQSGYISEYSTNTSRRSSIAHDLFPNPFQYQTGGSTTTTSGAKRQNSATYLSPSFQPHRGSASGLPSNLSTLSTLSNTSTTSASEGNKPLFKSEFSFDNEKKQTIDGKDNDDDENDKEKKKVMDITNLLG